MPKSDGQLPAKAAPAGVPVKRPLVRTLQSLEDLRRLQAKLLRAFLAGDIDERTFKAAMYGTTCLCATMKELKPPVDVNSFVGEIVICRHELDPALEAEIDRMNSSIMDAPADNSEV